MFFMSLLAYFPELDKTTHDTNELLPQLEHGSADLARLLSSFDFHIRLCSHCFVSNCEPDTDR